MAPPDIQNEIIEKLLAKPNQKADELAREIGCTRTLVNKLLYGSLKSQVKQDRNYRWHLVAKSERHAAPQADQDDEGFADTDLARLCRYYLACLGFDDTGIATFLTSKYGDPDYIELPALPRSNLDLADSEGARKILGRKRTERGRYGLYFGYPTHLNLIKSKRSSWQGFMVEPILLFPIEEEQGTGRLTIDLSFPIVNQRPFQNFTNVEREMLMNELVQLEQELGLAGEDGSPDLDEVAMRLKAIRPEWPWKEEIDPDVFHEDRKPIEELDEAGIYNRAIVIMAEKSPFTQGLEKELRDLAHVSANKYSSTVLGRWLNGEQDDTSETSEELEPLLEVLPMNSEQRRAVSAALTQPITIITGPPGTGKSQVVTNLLVNAAWSNKKVLFASKNNKAVDVVETRVNARGSRPILLRVGAQAYQARLAEYILALMSATTTDGEKEDFAEAKEVHERLLAEHSKLTVEAQSLIEARNRVDRLEQVAEDARSVLGQEIFSRAVSADTEGYAVELKSICEKLDRADRSLAGFFSSLFWPFVRKGRFAELSASLRVASETFPALNCKMPSEPREDDDILKIRRGIENASSHLEQLVKAEEYLFALKSLQEMRSLEAISSEETNVLQRIARHSEQLWDLWLRLQPSTLSADERKKLGKYTSLLKMVMEAGEDGQLSRQAFGKYNSMLRDISHLLPCWAVTSLSAKGRIPLEPGEFDIVVFDEASQCDIASAIPLLYRAKSVVVIGDPNQLSHISGLQRGQDQALLERYNLLEDFPHWAYSHQSLFSLGSTQVSGEGIVSLVDHHRSHSDIISFSNEEFYEERLRVATNYDKLRAPKRSEPGIRWIDVKGNVVRPGSGGAINSAEADAVVETLRELVIGRRYEGTVGVVTPFRAQANAITQAVHKDEVLSTALMKQGFLSDTVHKFQGDERDVMIFSPVVSANFPFGALGFLRSNGNLFNVAITRARAQLIVVGDRASCGACDVGYLSRFAGYAASIQQDFKQETDRHLEEYGPRYPDVAKPELVSDWERDFYVSAFAEGIKLIPQFNIEKYIADFLLVDGERSLVIEIDGERYHRNWSGELCRRDQIRNQRMFELGYDVMRFWVYEVRDDLPGCLERIKAWQSNI